MRDSGRDQTVIPQWSGFHKLTLEDKSHVTTYGYLPVLPHVSSEYDTVWTVIIKCSEIAKKLNNRYSVLTFDQAIYYKAKELQWCQPEDTKNVIIRLGGFHIVMNFLRIIGQFMTDSGLADVWLDSGIYAQSTINGILSGKKYNKAIRAHKLTYEALSRLLITLYKKWLLECGSPSVHSMNLIHLCTSEIIDTLRRKEDVAPLFDKITNLTRALLVEFPEFIEAQTATGKYWNTYLEMVDILLEFQFAERSGNWEKHLSSSRKMLPYFFSFDHMNYSRWGTIYLLDMYKLPEEAPEVHEEFTRGNFVVKRLNGNFNQLSVDQALEHINKNSKDAGGIVGLTKNSTKLDEWFLSYNVIGMMVDEFRASLDLSNHLSSQNVEGGKKRMKIDEDTVQKLHDEFLRFNVFSKNEDRLLVISTNEIASPNVQTSLLNVQKIGEECLAKFLDTVGTSNFYKPIKKNKLPTLRRAGSNKTVAEKRNIIQAGQEFLQKILAAKEMGREMNYEDIFKHELTAYPMSLAPAGVLSVPSNKSALGSIIEEFTLTYKSLQLPLQNHKTCHIFDGMSLIQAIGKPSNAKSFGDYVRVLKSIVFKNPYSAKRIDFVLDHYEESSMKNSTRQKRGTKNESIERSIEGPDTVLPQKWNSFIHSVFNKNQLTHFVSNQLVEYSLKNCITHFATSGGFFDVLQYKTNFGLNCELLCSSQEEADTRIILHILSAKMEGYTRCIVDCKDTDVLVLLAHFKDLLTPEVWMRVGTKDNERFIAIHELTMDLSLRKCLPAFHALTGCDTTSQFATGYLPVLPHVSSEYDTVWTVIIKCSEIAKKLNNRYTVLTFDQAIYYKAKELQWCQPEDTKNVIIRLGGFHIVMNFLRIIGQFMTDSGLADVWLDSGIYAQSTIDGILSGKKYNKAIRAHKLTYEALSRLLITLYKKWLLECGSPSVHSMNLIHLCTSEIIDTPRRKEDVAPLFDKITNLTRALLVEFPEFIEAQTATGKYWNTYLEMVDILLEFQFAERSGNWEKHLSSFRKMLPYFFSFDHMNYSRWGTIYLLDMYKLPEEAPEVHEEFTRGNFVVKRLNGNFNQLSVDQALEHINKNSKDAGGIVGLTKNSTKLDEWFLSYNVIGMMVDEFRASLDLSNHLSSQNVEGGKKRMKIDEDTVQKLHDEFLRFNVFSKNEDRLLVISTNEIASPNVQTSLLNVQKIGEECLAKFLDTVGTSNFYKPIKKNKLPTLRRAGSNKTVAEKRNIIQAGQEFLQKILAAKEMGREINYEDIFKHELTAYPMSLAPAGVLSVPSNKSALGSIIEEFTLTYKSLQLPLQNHKTCHIFDGMSLIQAIGKPSNAKSFGDYVRVLKSIVFKNPYSAKRIDFVLDHYEESSIKNSTRQKRGTKNESIERSIEGPDTVLPQKWNSFIHSVFNKNQLTHFVSNQLVEYSLKNCITHFATSGGFFDVLQYKTNFGLNCELLCSSQEEADTRIILHILSAKMEGYTRCIVDCKDTDLLVLLAHFKDLLTPEVWMRVGTKDNERFIAIHELTMDLSLRKCLPAFHALTGCDTTSQFATMGKKTCWKVFLSNYSLLSRVGSEEYLSKEVFDDIVKFVILLYTPNENIKCINTLRGILATTKPIHKLPPTLDSLRQHCLRVHFQTKIWLCSASPRPTLPSPLLNGWSEENGQLVPVLSTEPMLPKDTYVLSSCKCKKDCTGPLCSCKRKQIKCIGSCKCMAQVKCGNKGDIRETIFTVDVSSSDNDEESDLEK